MHILFNAVQIQKGSDCYNQLEKDENLLYSLTKSCFHLPSLAIA
jgi:hypothetical protein